MELKEGMYCRTDKGYIFKINEFIKHYTKGKRLYLKDKVEENFWVIGNKQCEIIESIDSSIPPCYPSDEELDKIKEHIINVSYNIIDLIEVGDYVNGEKVDEVVNRDDFKCVIYYYPYNEEYCGENEIKSIVTKEQFEKMKYEVE